MSTPARKRLMRDFKRLQVRRPASGCAAPCWCWAALSLFQKEPPPGISGTPTESNIMFWQAVIFGPEDTPWEGGARLRRCPGSVGWL